MKSLLLILLIFATSYSSDLHSAPLNGTYIIGSTGDYATIGGAVAAVITEGVSGPVTFKIMTGTYNEENTITAIPFASISNPVMFESMAGTPDSVVIMSPSGNAFYIQGASSIILRRLTMQSIILSGECSDILIRDNNFNIGSSYYNIDMNDGFVNTLNITQNKGLNGILFGSSDVSNDVGIDNNTFGSPFAYVIVSHISQLVFQNNFNIVNMNLNNISGISCSGNYVSSGSPGSYAMTIQQCLDAVISSNFIHSDENSYPVRLENNINMKFLSNTVKSDNTDTAMICYNNNVIKFINNIYSNNDEGYSISYVGNTNLSSDYNSYHNLNPNFIVRYNGTSYSLSGLTAATGLDSNSVMNNTMFAGPNDLHLHPSEAGNPLLVGVPDADVTVDIDGEMRNPVYPYKGADELDTPLPVELASFSYSVADNNVTLTWITTGEQNNRNFEIQRSSDNDHWSVLALIYGHGNSNHINEYSYADEGLASGKYYYRLKQMDYNGSFTYYNLAGEVVIGLPVKFSLSQNYPNPFNPETMISFELPSEQQVTLNIYDMTGKQVSTLVNEVRTAGNYKVKFNAGNLSSGVYYVKLTAGSFTDVKKMILTK